MKKQFLLSMLAAATLTVAADTVTPDWSGTTQNGVFTNIPEGWGVYGTDAYFSGSGSQITIYANSNNACLVSPPITGDMYFYIKPSFDYDDFFATLFEFDKNGDTYVKGLSLGSFDSVDGRVRYQVSVDDGKCVGFQIEYGILEEITYTPYEEPGTERPSLKVANASFGEGVSQLLSDEEGNVPFTMTVDVTNNGTVTLTPGYEGYQLTLTEGSSNVIMTMPLDITLEPGETQTVTLSGSFPMETAMESKVVGSNGAYRCGFNVKEGIKNSGLNSSIWMDVYPMWIYFETRVGQSKVTSLDFGFQTGTSESSRIVTINNLCINPLDINYITLPEGYTLETELPLSIPSTLESDHTADITVSMNTDAVGVVAGDMVIYVDGAEEPARIALSGARAGGDFFFEDFEDVEENGTPAGWVPDANANLKAKTYPSSWAMDDNIMCMENSSSSESYTGRVITPRLVAGENEYLVFQASSRSYSSSTPVVKVYYSTDRANWTELLRVRNAAYTADGQQAFSSEIPGSAYEGTALSTHSVAVPEGEGYIAFDVLYARIDNVFGLHRAQVDHDFFVTAQNAPLNGMVNHPVTFDVTVNNLGSAEAAGSYTLTLKANDRIVAVNEATPEMPQGSTTLHASFTPHAVGEVVLSAEIAAGSFTASSLPVTVNVTPEMAVAPIVVGEGTSFASNSGNKTVPFRTYDKNSLAQMIYTEAHLAQYGVTPGTKIGGISYYGWYGKRLHGPVSIWMQSTEMNEITPETAVDTADENKVYDNDDYVCEVMGSSTSPVELTAYNFETPYVYNGGNLLVTFLKHFDTYDTSGTGFVIDNTKSNSAIVKSTDTVDPKIYELAYNQAVGLPKTVFHAILDPSVYSGTVKDGQNDMAIADATVTLTSGDVLYSGVSGEDGTFSIDVIQSDKTYDVVVAKEGFYDYDGTVSFEDGDVNETVLLNSSGDGVKNLLADGINVRVLDELITVDTDATLTIYGTNGTMAARVVGNSVSLRNLSAGVYILKVATAEGETTVRFIKK